MLTPWWTLPTVAARLSLTWEDGRERVPGRAVDTMRCFLVLARSPCNSCRDASRIPGQTACQKFGESLDRARFVWSS